MFVAVVPGPRWRPKGKQKSTVHHALQMRGKSHANVREVLLKETSDQPEQE